MSKINEAIDRGIKFSNRMLNHLGRIGVTFEDCKEMLISMREPEEEKKLCNQNKNILCCPEHYRCHTGQEIEEKLKPLIDGLELVNREVKTMQHCLSWAGLKTRVEQTLKNFGVELQ
ncbi:hypothetical protein ACFL3D_01970 [Candidatus Omnitrophota bacterium]